MKTGIFNKLHSQHGGGGAGTGKPNAQPNPMQKVKAFIVSPQGIFTMIVLGFLVYYAHKGWKESK